MAGLGLPTTGRVTSGATPKLPQPLQASFPGMRGLPQGARLIAQGSGVGTGQVPASDPYGQLPATAANYRPYEPSTPPVMPATDGSGFVAPGGGIGSAMRYDEATGYKGNDPSHPVNFATGAGMGFEPTDVHGVHEQGGNNFTNIPSVYNEANQISPSGAAEQLATNMHNQGANLSPAQQNALLGGTGASYDKPAPSLKPFSDPGSVSSYQKMIGPPPAGLPSASGMPQRVNPMKSPLVDSFFTGRAPYLGVPNISAAIPTPGQVTAAKPKPAAQQAGNFIGGSIGDAWGAGPGVPTAPDAPTFTPSKWAGTHAVEDAYNSGLGRFTTSGIGDYWGAGKGMPKAPKVPAIYDPADWWISKQLGSFGRGLAGS
ncbi:hypothetical protein [Acidithiobacillus ferrivorans]|uniref:Uncharacterized protein n=1 Tax=Acidithiobacillus ferrivorans TaxID=160808 RepID=A0A7T5BHP1_9PROT|nr:hypothetical protein [Acidithiobacillus ferrivorans]QQD73584.1 hypothetical protein H2515_04750 [Acidithiobacillus ferrivorans]